jgi:hypothetical protein
VPPPDRGHVTAASVCRHIAPPKSESQRYILSLTIATIFLAELQDIGLVDKPTANGALIKLPHLRQFERGVQRFERCRGLYFGARLSKRQIRMVTMYAAVEEIVG